MRKGRRSTAPPAPKKPADAAAAAPHVRTFMVKLFDRDDGKAADWPLIAETLLREAFHALDQSPGDPRVLALLRRVNAGPYDRLTGNAPESDEPGTEVKNLITNNTDCMVQQDCGRGPTR